jgi:hypothetical protein
MQRLVLGFCSPAPQKLGHFPQLEGKSWTEDIDSLGP